MKARAGFLAGLIAAALAAWPAAMRVESGLVGQAFFVLFASAAFVMAPLSAALAAADAPSRFTRALTVGMLVSAAPLLPFATVLKTSTHHRPLGGVTFAVLAGVIVVGLSLSSVKLVTWAGEQARLPRLLGRAAILGLTALGAAALVLGLARGLTGDPAFRVGFFDALRMLGLATLAAWVPIPAAALRFARGFGLAAWIAVVTVGVCLGRTPSMQAELAAHCPVLHWPLQWLGG
ncbi:MAG TPA: hypothetical protein VHV51_03335 [Polyangiaceae bacterium]|nr:hypothetical protein [Polyangiaceae bacterium]